MRRRLAALAVLLAVLCGACSQATTTPVAARLNVPPTTAKLPDVVYVAVGASETVGVGSDDPIREGWTRLFFQQALTPGAVFYNLGVPGITTRDAVDRELPTALDLAPTVVTVWLNVNDLIAGVPAADYEASLRTLVHALRRGGATQVLVANTPDVVNLPAFVACRNGTKTDTCPPQALENPAAMAAAVDAYDAAAARVAADEGATLVDLHAAGDPAGLTADDGLHPNDAGHRAVAARFIAAYRP